MARQPKREKPTATAAPTDYFIGRERLFARLDDLSGRAVWLQGPTGAGKTVLLRTYVRRSAGPVLWLAIDVKSTTPDALFNALAQAAHRAGVEDLPQFAGEHRQAPSEFMRISAERIVQRLPGATVVIDDAQRLLPALAPLLQVLIDACCTDLRLLFAGQDLPLGLEPQIAASKLVVVGHAQLQFDEAEANELAKRVGAAEALAHAMRERTSGWAAGLMLALQLGQGATTANAQRRLEGPLASLVHGGVLAGVAPEAVKALAAIAPARYIPINLAKLGEPWKQAVEELERLSERGLFVERLDNGDLRLHDLFCSALRQERVDDTDRDDAVEALSNIDRHELALVCIIAGSDCGEGLQHWLEKHGDALLMRTDIGQLSSAVLQYGQLPPSVLLWCARGAMANDLALADALADSAFQAFQALPDARGQRESCGVGLLAQSVLIDAERLKLWQARMPTVSPAFIETDEIRLLECGGRLVEHVLQPSRANSPEIHAVHACLHKALLEPQRAQEAILAASVLVFALLQLQRRQEIPALLSEMERAPWFPSISPYAHVEWLNNKGCVLVSIGRVEAAMASFNEASAIARRQGMTLLLRTALTGLARAQITVGAVDDAERTLAETGHLTGDAGTHLRVNEHCLMAQLDVARGRMARALNHLETAERLLQDAGIPVTGQLQRARVQVLFATKQHEEAILMADRCVAGNEGAMRDSAQCERELLLAMHLWGNDEAAANAALARGMGLVEQRRWTGFLLLLPREAGLVSHRALRSGYAGDIVRDAIRERRLPAPADAGADWPWPLRIFVLGTWQLKRFDEVMEFRGKVQRKPLELLKFLACARDQTADHATVCRALWPDADDTAARRSLEMATARLREILGNASWVVVAAGRSCLDPEFVWSDAQAFWRAGESVERLARRNEATAIRDAAERMLQLYRGDLLAGDEETPWLLGARERIRAAFVRAVRGVSTALQERAQPQVAIALLERAFSAEPLAEELAQRLMSVYMEIDQPNEAMRIYRSLRQVLSVTLGRTPAAASEKLRQSIVNQQEGRVA